MSIITLQLGQCGNQIGGQLFQLLSEDLDLPPPSWCSADLTNDYVEENSNRFFDVSESSETGFLRTARAVMVDTEPKVIAQMVTNSRRSGKWCYPPKQQVCQKRGSGNNWAHGFFHHGPLVEERVLDAVQREAEKCNMVGGFLALMSLAGGTGSGVGAFVTKCLRDNYPHSFILNQVVWPYAKGEVAVQSYNSILSLAHLYQSADALLMMQNDCLHRTCSQLLAVPKVSFGDINSLISHYLALSLVPVYDCLPLSPSSLISSHMGDLMHSLASHPEYKMLTVRSIPHVSRRSADFSSYQWPGLVKHLRQMLIANASMEEGINWQLKCGMDKAIRSVSNLLIIRGRDSAQVDCSAFKEPRLYVDWLSTENAFTCWSHPRPFSHHEKSVTLLSNSQSVAPLLDQVIERGWHMFSSRAYVHQYQKHGLEVDDFVDCFAGLEQVLASYNCL